MNCREYIIEFEDRAGLSEPATLHLTICADCRKTSEQQTQVWLMIDDLKPVAAPSDFDFHVKAKIAQAKPSDFQSPRFLPILRYVLPLSAMVLLLGLFFYNSAYFSGTQIARQTTPNIIETPSGNAVLPADLSPTNQIAFGESDKPKPIFAPSSSNDSPANSKRTAERLSKTRVPNPKTSIDTDSGGGSHIFASSDPGANTFSPAGIDVKNANSVNAPKIESPKPANDENVLKFFGIHTIVMNGKRTVKLVDKNSAAEHSGVEIGDVVEKIKDNFLTISRGVEKIEITLLNETNQKP